MLEILRTVRGAVSSKDLVPVLTHFCIYNGRIQGSNGRVAIDCPCPELKGYEFTVHADRFLRAVDCCGGEPTLEWVEGKLSIRRAAFKAKLPTLPAAAFPLQERRVQPHEAPSLDWLRVLDFLQPFVSTDASRPWSCSVLLHDGYAYATNNAILVRTPCPWPGPPLILPNFVVDEVLRIKEQPTRVTFDDHRVTFEYGDVYMTSQLLAGSWPDLSGHMAMLSAHELVPIPAELLKAVRVLVPFFPDAKTPVVVFDDTGVRTLEGEHSAEMAIGALTKAAYRLENLVLVLEHASAWAPNTYPAPMPFTGAGIEGLLIGVKF